VHQDGLVHVSALSNKFVKDPHEVVKAGDVVKVKVLEVDIPRKRIALTMRLTDEVGAKRPDAGGPRGNNDRGGASSRDMQRYGSNNGSSGGNRNAPQVESAMASAFAKLKR
jgi:protein Tex